MEGKCQVFSKPVVYPTVLKRRVGDYAEAESEKKLFGYV